MISAPFRGNPLLFTLVLSYCVRELPTNSSFYAIKMKMNGIVLNIDSTEISFTPNDEVNRCL